MNIIVQLTDQAANEFAKSQNTGVYSSALARLLVQYNSSFKAMHPDTSDATLRSYFILTTPDSENAQQLTKELQVTNGVLAAYIKPKEQTP